MSNKWIKEGQKQLDDMLTTLHQAGFIKLILEDGKEFVHEKHEKFDEMVVRAFRKHRTLLLNWFRSQGLSSGMVEGFNNKVKLTVRKGYGYGSDESLKITLFHALGRLPEPKGTHRFW